MVARSIDFSAAGRSDLELYFSGLVGPSLLTNLSVSKRLLDSALGVGTRRVPSPVRTVCDIVSGFVLDEVQVEHLLAHERRVSVWKSFLWSQPERDGLRDILRAKQLGRQLDYTLRAPYHLELDAARFQKRASARCAEGACLKLHWCTPTQCRAHWTFFDGSVNMDQLRWQLESRSGYATQGGPASEWLVRQFGDDFVAWDLFFSLSSGWTGSMEDLVATIDDLLPGVRAAS
jgi:hypothetical protein